MTTYKDQIFRAITNKAMSVREISDQVGCSTGYCKKLIERSRDFLVHDGWAKTTNPNGQKAKRWRLSTERFIDSVDDEPSIETALNKKHTRSVKRGELTKHLEGVWPRP